MFCPTFMTVPRLFVFFAFALTSIFLSSLSAERLRQPVEQLLPSPLHRTITLPTGTEIRAEIADTPESRKKGLMFRDRLPENEGMLFVFEQAMPHHFWMKNCRFPIDIIWMNEQKEIVYIAESVPPCEADPCPNYGPTDIPSRYVLEVVAGGARREKLAIKQQLKF